MAKVILGITMSVDGFINDDSGSVDRLYSDFEAMLKGEPLLEAIQNTGAVVMGRHAFAMSEDPDWYAGNYEFQVPIFVLTHKPPKKQPKAVGQLSFTFVTDGIESAIRQAKAAAGDKNVLLIGGATTLRQCLKARLADELQIDIMPVLLCGGLRMFEVIGSKPVNLERIRVMELPEGRTHIAVRVLR